MAAKRKMRAAMPEGRAWKLLRLALQWARKGGAFRRWRRAHRLLRGTEREFSIQETPAFRFGGMRRRFLDGIPCFRPAALENFDVEKEAAFLKEDLDFSMEVCDEEDEEEEDGEQGIDRKAERFIVEFYEQMRLQRQISYLEYDQMLCRSIS